MPITEPKDLKETMLEAGASKTDTGKIQFELFRKRAEEQAFAKMGNR